MEYRRWIRCIILLVSGLSLFRSPQLLSCTWSWLDDMELVRMSLFHAEIGNMPSFRENYYSCSLLHAGNPPENNDWIRNCKEWQAQTGSSVRLMDIREILYNTLPSRFIHAYNARTLHQEFPRNTFAAFLASSANHEYAKYMYLAKHVENLYVEFKERWNNYGNASIDTSRVAEDTTVDVVQFCDRERKQAISDFLRQRYTFQKIRYIYSEGSVLTLPAHIDTVLLSGFVPVWQVLNSCMDWHIQEWELHNVGSDTEQRMHLKNEVVKDIRLDTSSHPSVISVWTMMYLGLANSGTAEGNYILSLVFDKSDEKKHIALENFESDPDTIKATLKLARTPHEKAVIRSMIALKNPGPALDQIQEIALLTDSGNYMEVLVMREINKFEDWLLTSKCYGESSVHIPDVSESYTEENIVKDKIRLEAFREYLKTLYPTLRKDLKDFYALAIAHLCFLGDHTAEGTSYLNKVSTNTSASIAYQRAVEMLLVMITNKNLDGVRNRQTLTRYLAVLDDAARDNVGAVKVVVSILNLLSHAYYTKQEIATAGLLMSKSLYYQLAYFNAPKVYDHSSSDWVTKMLRKTIFTRKLLKKTATVEEEERWVRDEKDHFYYDDNSYYRGIWYWDSFARYTDIQQLLARIHNPNKDRFDQYLLAQRIPDDNVLNDICGTLAFRVDSLSEALSSFSKIPSSFWKTRYAFSRYLNNNPFIPKCWTSKQDSAYKHYLFNKTDFIRTLLTLRERISRRKNDNWNDCMQLGNAYYNCTYWGNSWMMMKYGKSITEPRIDGDVSDYTMACSDQLIEDAHKSVPDHVYYSCSRAYYWYKRALSSANDSNQFAATYYMLHNCEINDLKSRQVRFIADESDRRYKSKTMLRIILQSSLFNPLVYLADGVTMYANETKELENTLVRNFTFPSLTLLYQHYRNTSVYMEVQCPVLDHYMALKSR